MQENAHADRRNQQRQARRILDQQAMVREPLDDNAQQGANRNRQDYRRPKRQAELHHHDEHNVAANHDDIAMCEVNELDNAVYHAVAQGHQRVNAAKAKAVNHLDEKIHKRTFLL